MVHISIAAATRLIIISLAAPLRLTPLNVEWLFIVIIALLKYQS